MLSGKNVRSTTPAEPLPAAETSKQEPDGHRPRRATMDRSNLVSDEPSLQRTSLTPSREGTPSISFAGDTSHDRSQQTSQPSGPTTTSDEQWSRHTDPSAHRRGRSGSTDRSPSTSLLRDDREGEEAPVPTRSTADHSHVSEPSSYLRMADYTATSSTFVDSSGSAAPAPARARHTQSEPASSTVLPSHPPSLPRPAAAGVYEEDTVPLAEPPVQARTPPKNAPARDWRQHILDDLSSALGTHTPHTHAEPPSTTPRGPGATLPRLGGPSPGVPATAATPAMPPHIPGWGVVAKDPGLPRAPAVPVSGGTPRASVHRDGVNDDTSPPVSPTSRSNASTPRSILRRRSQERDRPTHKRNLRITFASEPRETSQDVFAVGPEDNDDEPSLRYDPTPELDAEEPWIASASGSEDPSDEEEDSVYSSVDDDDFVERPLEQAPAVRLAGTDDDALYMHARTATAPPAEYTEATHSDAEDEEDEATIEVSDRRRRQARLEAGRQRPFHEQTPERPDPEHSSGSRAHAGIVDTDDDEYAEDVRTQPQKAASRKHHRPHARSPGSVDIDAEEDEDEPPTEATNGRSRLQSRDRGGAHKPRSPSSSSSRSSRGGTTQAPSRNPSSLFTADVPLPATGHLQQSQQHPRPARHTVSAGSPTSTPPASRGASPSVASSGGGSASRLPPRRVSSTSPPGSGASTPLLHPKHTTAAQPKVAAGEDARRARQVHLRPVGAPQRRPMGSEEHGGEEARRHERHRPSSWLPLADAALPPSLQEPVYLEPTSGPVALLPDDLDEDSVPTGAAAAAVSPALQRQQQALAEALAQSGLGSVQMPRPSSSSRATGSTGGSSSGGGLEGALSDEALSSIPTSLARRSVEDDVSGSERRSHSGEGGAAGGVSAEELARALAGIVGDTEGSGTTMGDDSALAPGRADDGVRDNEDGGVPLKPGKVKRKKLVVVTRVKPKNADPTEADPIVKLSLLPFQQRRASQIRMAAERTRSASRASSASSGALVALPSQKRSPGRPLETLYEHAQRTSPRSSAIAAERQQPRGRAGAPPGDAHGATGKGEKKASAADGSDGEEVSLSDAQLDRQRFRRALSVLSSRSARSSLAASRRSSVHAPHASHLESAEHSQSRSSTSPRRPAAVTHTHTPRHATSEEKKTNTSGHLPSQHKRSDRGRSPSSRHEHRRHSRRRRHHSATKGTQTAAATHTHEEASSAAVVPPSMEEILRVLNHPLLQSRNGGAADGHQSLYNALEASLDKAHAAGGPNTPGGYGQPRHDDEEAAFTDALFDRSPSGLTPIHIQQHPELAKKLRHTAAMREQKAVDAFARTNQPNPSPAPAPSTTPIVSGNMLYNEAGVPVAMITAPVMRPDVTAAAPAVVANRQSELADAFKRPIGVAAWPVDPQPGPSLGAAPYNAAGKDAYFPWEQHVRRGVEDMQRNVATVAQGYLPTRPTRYEEIPEHAPPLVVDNVQQLSEDWQKALRPSAHDRPKPSLFRGARGTMGATPTKNEIGNRGSRKADFLLESAGLSPYARAQDVAVDNGAGSSEYYGRHVPQPQLQPPPAARALLPLKNSKPDVWRGELATDPRYGATPDRASHQRRQRLPRDGGDVDSNDSDREKYDDVDDVEENVGDEGDYDEVEDGAAASASDAVTPDRYGFAQNVSLSPLGASTCSDVHGSDSHPSRADSVDEHRGERANVGKDAQPRTTMRGARHQSPTSSSPFSSVVEKRKPSVSVGGDAHELMPLVPPTEEGKHASSHHHHHHDRHPENHDGETTSHGEADKTQHKKHAESHSHPRSPDKVPKHTRGAKADEKAKDGVAHGESELARSKPHWPDSPSVSFMDNQDPSPVAAADVTAAPAPSVKGTSKPAKRPALPFGVVTPETEEVPARRSSRVKEEKKDKKGKAKGRDDSKKAERGAHHRHSSSSRSPSRSRKASRSASSTSKKKDKKSKKSKKEKARTRSSSPTKSSRASSVSRKDIVEPVKGSLEYQLAKLKRKAEAKAKEEKKQKKKEKREKKAKKKKAAEHKPHRSASRSLPPPPPSPPPHSAASDSSSRSASRARPTASRIWASSADAPSRSAYRPRSVPASASSSLRHHPDTPVPSSWLPRSVYGSDRYDRHRPSAYSARASHPHPRTSSSTSSRPGVRPTTSWADCVRDAAVESTRRGSRSRGSSPRSPPQRGSYSSRRRPSGSAADLDDISTFDIDRLPHKDYFADEPVATSAYRPRTRTRDLPSRGAPFDGRPSGRPPPRNSWEDMKRAESVDSAGSRRSSPYRPTPRQAVPSQSSTKPRVVDDPDVVSTPPGAESAVPSYRSRRGADVQSPPSPPPPPPPPARRRPAGDVGEDTVDVFVASDPAAVRAFTNGLRRASEGIRQYY